MTKVIKVIRANGETEILEKAPTLAEMQKIVGGYIEHVTVLDRVENGKNIYTSMYVNEEGLLDELPRNVAATEIYQRNIRQQFPDSATPFADARKEYEETMGGNIVDMTPAGLEDYANDPWIAGDVILFEGYTCDEANRMFVG